MKRALIVDDTKNIRILLSTCMELMGYDSVCAKDGEEALNILKKEEFDLIFLDIKMPEISGTEVLRKARDMGVETPVIIMTAFATVKNAVDCTKLGAVAYLQKPFTQEKIKNVVNQVEVNIDKGEEDIRKISQCIMEKRYENGIQMCRKMLANNPEDGQIYYLLSQLYKLTGDEEKAEKFYLTAKVFGFQG